MIAKSWETDPGKSAFAEVLKVKNVKYPDPNVIHPIVGYELGVKKLPKVKELNAEYAGLLSGKKAAYAEYRKLRDEAQELSVAVRNIASLYDAELQEQQKIKEEKTH